MFGSRYFRVVAEKLDFGPTVGVAMSQTRAFSNADFHLQHDFNKETLTHAEIILRIVCPQL